MIWLSDGQLVGSCHPVNHSSMSVMLNPLPNCGISVWLRFFWNLTFEVVPQKHKYFGKKYGFFQVDILFSSQF